jgi:zinc protease
MEQKVKVLFSTISAKSNSAKRIYFPIEDSKELGFVVAKDKEAQGVSINWIFRKDVEAVKDETSMRQDMAQSMFNSLINSRLSELTQKPDCPALGMQVGNYSIARTKDGSYLAISPKENKEKEAFALLISELERARRFGFNQSELDRVKTSFLRSYESYQKEYDKIDNDKWAKQLGDNFLKADPFPSLTWEMEFAQKTIPSITLDEVSANFANFQNQKNSIISVSGPDKEDIIYPTKEELLEEVQKVMSTEITAYEDDANDDPLVNDELAEKNIVKTTLISETEARLYTLENGAKVVVLPTELSKDEILFNAFSFGGMSILTQEQLESANIVTGLASRSGVGEFNAVQLRKKLTGKIAKVTPAIGSTIEGFNGSASPKDFETMLQLLYLQFEHPRFEKESYETILGSMKNQLAYVKTDNNKAFSDTIQQVSSNYSPRSLMFGETYFNNLDFDKAVAVYKDRIQDASDFTFIFVGNIDLDKDLALIRKYIGNLSSTYRKESWVNHHIKPAKGATSRVVEREMEVPKSTVYYSLYKDVKYNLKTQVYVKAIGDLLSKRYLETIREEEGGSYGVGVRPTVSKIEYEHATISMNFDCDPEKRARLTEIMKQEIVDMVKKGVKEDDLNEIKKNYIKSREEAIDQNRFWLKELRGSLLNQEPVISTDDYEQLINKMTARGIQKYARKLFKGYDSIEVVMTPASEK